MDDATAADLLVNFSKMYLDTNKCDDKDLLELRNKIENCSIHWDALQNKAACVRIADVGFSSRGNTVTELMQMMIVFDHKRTYTLLIQLCYDVIMAKVARSSDTATCNIITDFMAEQDFMQHIDSKTYIVQP